MEAVMGYKEYVFRTLDYTVTSSPSTLVPMLWLAMPVCSFLYYGKESPPVNFVSRDM